MIVLLLKYAIAVLGCIDACSSLYDNNNNNIVLLKNGGLAHVWPIAFLYISLTEFSVNFQYETRVTRSLQQNTGWPTGHEISYYSTQLEFMIYSFKVVFQKKKKIVKIVTFTQRTHLCQALYYCANNHIVL